MTLHDLLQLWGKVKKLASQNCTKSQIAAVLNLDRHTVAKYLGLQDEAQVEAFYTARFSKKAPQHHYLSLNEEFFIKQIKHPAHFSCSQIMDHYKEHYPAAPEVSRATLSRYLDELRKRENVHKPKKSARTFRRRLPDGAGKEAQADFGEGYIYDSAGNRHPYHFFILTLSYSAKKFVYFIKDKFDAPHAVYALHRAFEYLNGRPERVVMDRDSVFFAREEIDGRAVMTSDLDSFVREAGFKADFCHARDPQSKGRVEKYVNFVKDNFLNGREFKDYGTLNRECIQWLKRTGNGQKHDLYNLSPDYMFNHGEKQALAEYDYHMEDPDWKPTEYKVHKDNTIRFRHRTILDVPPGTYRGEGSKVLVDDKADPERLLILDADGRTLVEYPKNLSQNTHHTLPAAMLRDNGMYKYETMLRQHLNQWDDDDPLSKLLSAIRKDIGERYYKKSFKALWDLLEKIDEYSACRLVGHCVKLGKTRFPEIQAAMRQLHIDGAPGTEGGGEAKFGSYDFSDLEGGRSNKDDENFEDYNLEGVEP